MNVFVTINLLVPMALLKGSRFSVRMAYVMRTENQSNGRAHGCDHAQIFCAHGLIHAHRKSRVIGVRMAMCTSKPIIGKDAPRGAPPFPTHAGNARKNAFFSSGDRPLEGQNVFHESLDRRKTQTGSVPKARGN